MGQINTNNITEKYKDFDSVSCVSIFADDRNGLRTLEPQFVDVNKDNLAALCVTIKIDNSRYDTEDKIAEYMTAHKTEWALNVFESNMDLVFPQYITNAVGWCNV